MKLDQLRRMALFAIVAREGFVHRRGAAAKHCHFGDQQRGDAARIRAGRTFAPPQHAAVEAHRCGRAVSQSVASHTV